MSKWKRDNCLFYAARQAITKGEYVVCRISRRRHKWPICHYHFMVVPKYIIDKYAESYVPIAETLGNWPLPLFRGQIKRGD